MNLPNLLSVIRLFMIPAFAYVFFSGMPNAYLYAIIIFLLAGLTDILDGMIARKLNMTTRLGKILDPLADKLMVFTALSCCWVAEIIPWWLPAVYFAKEVIQAAGSALFFRKVKDMLSSNIYGKMATFTFYIVIAVLTLVRRIPELLKNIMMAIPIALGLISFLIYTGQALTIVSRQKKQAG